MEPETNRAPDTLAGLRLLLDRIQRREAEFTLGGQALRALAALIEAPEQAAVSSIAELAALVGVDPATLSRLARRLGYGGFSKLQDVFRRELTEGRHFYSEQATRLLYGSEQDSLALLARLGRQESANIAALIDGIAAAEFEAAAELLASARRVRIHGMRQFSSLAFFMSYALGMLRQDVGVLDAGRQGVADGLAQLQPGDAVVVASCFPYTRSSIAAAQIAARHGMAVIALTDTRSSPLAEVARHRFFVPNGSVFYSNSMCAFVLLVEGLLTLVAQRLGDTGLAALQQREILIEELDSAL